MDDSRIARMEHFALETSLSLAELCARIRDELALPEFELDGENETEWGTSEQGGIEYNVSRPYKRGTLRGWDPSVPDGCNVGVTVILALDHPRCGDELWIREELVRGLCDRFDRALGAKLHHHRTWLPHRCP